MGKKTSFMTKDMKSSYLINFIAIIVLYIIVGVLMLTGVLSRYNSSIIILVLINIIMATSLNFSTGFLGQLVLGHAGFMAIGAYSAGFIMTILVQSGVSSLVASLLALVVAGVFAGIAGIIIGIPALRLRGDYLAIMTLAFGEIVRITINNFTFVGGAQGFAGIPGVVSKDLGLSKTMETFARYSYTFVIMLICVAFLVLLGRSRHGRAIISIKENEIAAEAVGVNTTSYKVKGFALSAMIAGIGGGVFAYQIGFIQPTMFGFMKSVDFLVIVVLGGMGSMTGSVLAAIVFTFLPEWLRDFNEYRMIAYAILLIVMMIVRPQGIFGTREMSFASRILGKYKERKQGGTK